MPEYIFQMKDLRKVVPPGREILKGISLSFFFGAKIGVIGANGAGKSSLLRIMAGEDSRFLGEALPARGIRTGFLPQEPRLDPKKTVLGNVEEGVREARALLDRYNAISERLGAPLDTGEMETLLEEQAQVQDRIDATNAWELDRTLEIAMDALRCPPPDADVAAISGGERRRVALCRLLLSRPDLLLLDEPTNHLDAESVGMAPRARQAKSKARLAAYERLLAEETERLPETVEIYIPPGPRLGGVVVEAEHLRKGYGDLLLIEDMTLTLPPGGIVGVIGPNGAGKTTLFRMVVGRERPDSGILRLGETVRLAYVDQSRESLDGERSVWEVIADGEETIELGKRRVSARSYAASFNFKGPDQQKKVKDLSGGERNRVHLARVLKSGANVLLLDEPTNDLDVDTLRALEEALLNFAGCAVVISHDRWFLDRTATHILAFEGDSRVVWFEGNYQDYHADLLKRLGAAAAEPHRIKYRKLTHG